MKTEPLGDITEILDEYKEGPVRILLQGIGENLNISHNK